MLTGPPPKFHGTRDILNGEQVSLNGVVDFEVDKRYLVTASEGTVTSCGFTAEWSPEMAADFEAGFQR